MPADVRQRLLHNPDELDLRLGAGPPVAVARPDAVDLDAPLALEAAQALETAGISIEIVDPLTLDPLDMELILASVQKTRHVVIVHETRKTCGWGGEVAARLADEALGYLDGPIKRVGAKHTPIPFSPVLESFVLPQPGDILTAVHECLG